MTLHRRSSFPRRVYRKLKRIIRNARNRGRSPREVFEEIYRRSEWGRNKDEFSSGTGTEDERITGPYVQAVERLLREQGLVGGTFVDLGCGDFKVGSTLCRLASKYIAVDVVGPLIEGHRSRGWGGEVEFQQLDITSDPVPGGDVCFVRQVFQHLSNAQILRVLPKLSAYRLVIITEHIPEAGDLTVANADKVQGGDIRLFGGSGVFLDQPPFNLPADKLETLVEVPGHEFGGGICEPGVIRTSVYRP